MPERWHDEEVIVVHGLGRLHSLSVSVVLVGGHLPSKLHEQFDDEAGLGGDNTH